MIRLVLALLAIAALAGCQQSSTTTSDSSSSTSSGATSTPAETKANPAPTPTETPATPGGKEVRLPSGLAYTEEVVGNGALAENGRTVAVQYTCRLPDGTKVDSSKERGQPLTFQLGAGQMVRGFEEGVKGMRIGGKRTLTVPPDMAWGSQGSGVIPPNATVLFDVELVEVR